MLLDSLTINSLIPFIMGDNTIAPYNSGPQLIQWFNQYGFNDTYSRGLPEGLSRKYYTLDRVTKINNEPSKMKKFLESIIDPRRVENNNINKIAEIINSFIKHDKFILKKVNGVYKLYNLDNSDFQGVFSVFEEIQEKILEEINSANFLIWVAVSWFTDPVLYDALVKKRKSGLNVRVIIIDDEINRNSGLNFEKGFSTKRVKPEWNFNNIMHQKYCIIDLKEALHGSYNWTKKAKFNQESMDILEGRELVEPFAKEFVKLASVE